MQIRCPADRRRVGSVDQKAGLGKAGRPASPALGGPPFSQGLAPPRFLERLLVRPDLTWTEATTAPGAVVNFMNHEGREWGKLPAVGTMVMLPVLFFSILVRKFLVHGLTAGALKG
jgi:hypothetical protein